MAAQVKLATEAMPTRGGAAGAKLVGPVTQQSPSKGADRWQGRRARARVAPLFGALGQRTIWVGEAGAGTRLKLVNNTWLAFAAEAVATSVALAHRLGLDTGTVVDGLGGGPLMSTWQAAKLQRIANGEFSAQFALSLALKDVHLALQAAGGDRFAVLACLADEWQQAVDQGLGGQDLTVVTRALEQQEGTP
jgi:3-hydroxyisobutyrate dehydrogenase